ncbi:MAG: PepSY domain-containing protein [Alphaproteobacteria bacterium]|nr:PepSY domain-containing protein [Alphaproteobacteria bacterium]MDE2514107.1 PepSY domain-containing protein [Alphaproteobacteria bacterium]
MTRLNTLTAIGAFALAAIVGATTASAFKGEDLVGEAAVSLDQARVIALKAVPGTIADEELEKESGGSGLRYTFDIQADNATHEVGVDAKTGAILESSVEGPNAD